MFLCHIANGRCRLVEDVAPHQPSFEEGFLWCHLDEGLAAAGEWLSRVDHADEQTIAALCDELTRPRVFVNQHDEVIVTLRAMRTAQEGNLATLSVRIWLSHKMLVTVSREPIAALDELSQRYARRIKGIETPYHLLWQLTDVLTDHITAYVADQDDNLISLEDGWEADSRLDRDVFHAARYRTSHLRRFLYPQLEALQKLSTVIVDQEGLDKEAVILHRARWREILNSQKRDFEALVEMRERITILQDALAQRTSETTNRTILLLSLVATFFLPMTFFASLLGMNVEGIPAHDEPWAFAGVCLIMALIAAAQWWLFRRWNWLK